MRVNLVEAACVLAIGIAAVRLPHADRGGPDALPMQAAPVAQLPAAPPVALAPPAPRAAASVAPRRASSGRDHD
jgi:hypothetical protein